MTDKRKKQLLAAGLTVVCVALGAGIYFNLYKSDDKAVPIPAAIEVENDVKVEPETEPVKEEITVEAKTEPEPLVTEEKQAIQKTPEKTEEEKPTEPPTEEIPQAENEVKKEEPKKEPPVESKPKEGERKDGMVYFEGFGWVKDEGAGEGTYADDMYENGNKIGNMD